MSIFLFFSGDKDIEALTKQTQLLQVRMDTLNSMLAAEREKNAELTQRTIQQAKPAELFEIEKRAKMAKIDQTEQEALNRMQDAMQAQEVLKQALRKLPQAEEMAKLVQELAHSETQRRAAEEQVKILVAWVFERQPSPGNDGESQRMMKDHIETMFGRKIEFKIK